jgi:hypothetical protein
MRKKLIKVTTPKHNLIFLFQKYRLLAWTLEYFKRHVLPHTHSARVSIAFCKKKKSSYLKIVCLNLPCLIFLTKCSQQFLTESSSRQTEQPSGKKLKKKKKMQTLTNAFETRKCEHYHKMIRLMLLLSGVQSVKILPPG